MILPESIHRANILKPNTWIVPRTYLTEIDDDNPETNTGNNEKLSVQQENVKQRILSFKEMLLTTFVSYPKIYRKNLQIIFL